MITSRRTTTEINRHAIVHRSPDQRTTEARLKRWTRAEGADSLALFVAKDDQGGDLQVSKTVNILCQKPNIPVGGRLRYFYQKWAEITDDQWVLSVIEHGYRLEFHTIPHQTGVRQTSVSISNPDILLAEVNNLLNKNAIEPVTTNIQAGFYSTFF